MPGCAGHFIIIASSFSVRARSMGHPLFSLSRNLLSFKQYFSAYSPAVRLSPLKRYFTVIRLFLCCCFCVAQRQLLGLYGPSLSVLSMECFRDGRFPMSSRKVSKDNSHCLHMVIPRPPYAAYPLDFLLRQRSFMCDQATYSGVLFPSEAAPCFVTARSIASL